MMINLSQGDLLAADAEALVNTVNTVGVMGKGIALQFKNAYPEMFKAYHRAAKAGDIRIGEMFVWDTGLIEGPKFIINFPTKRHWREKSRMGDIEQGLRGLTEVVERLAIRSIAVPPLGCGNGGLAWNQVEPRIQAALGDIPGVEVLLFAPVGAPRAAEITVATRSPRMTTNRAALVTIIDRYIEQSWSTPGLIEVQKLMYFLQVGGQPLRLDYSANRYGPYADNLRHVLKDVEGHYLTGFGDGSAKVEEAEPLEVLPGVSGEALKVLEDQPETRARIDRVLDLAQGFESAYGLELLATVHWLARDDPQATTASIAPSVAEWSSRKARMFTPSQIDIALARLRSKGWLEGKGSEQAQLAAL